MKKTFIVLIGLLVLFSCEKQVIEPSIKTEEGDDYYIIDSEYELGENAEFYVSDASFDSWSNLEHLDMRVNEFPLMFESRFDSINLYISDKEKMIFKGVFYKGVKYEFVIFDNY